MNFLSDFGVQPILLAAQVVNFFILLFILKKFLYKPILKVLEKRKETIAQSLKQAQEIELKLAKTEEEREKVLAKAADEARKIVDEAIKSSNQLALEARQKTQADIEIMLKKSEQQQRLEREKMHQEIRGELADLVALALQKVTGKVLTKKDQKELIEKSVKELN